MNSIDLNLLRELCSVRALSGNELPMKEYLLNYIEGHLNQWKVKPQVIHGDDFQDCVILIFGTPRTAVYAHIDSIGFTAGYNNNLIKVGWPKIIPGTRLVGRDSIGEIACVLETDEENQVFSAVFERTIDRGTELTFKPDFRFNEPFIQSCYIDNRLGVWVALKLAETLENGAIVFSCWEEHGGGTAGYLAGWLYNNYRIRQALISDITWVTDGVLHGEGVAISLRDSGIPRRSFFNKIRKVLDDEMVKYQIEVESAGGSDGTEIQKSPFPVDWCFVGAPESQVHSPDEKVHTDDIQSMLNAYKVLMDRL
jgi:putative aminopeptidase FrvX